ncbi:ribonucleases P/MRP protein subunit POP1-domain-containing protein [Dipodascopsis uninucleata]
MAPKSVSLPRKRLIGSVEDGKSAEDQKGKRNYKRSRVLNARTILAQESDASLQNGHINVEKFVEARRFEIEQLENAMKNSKAIQKQQTFQAVPRRLRRRAASHNVKFVPLRLRKQASQDLAQNTPRRKQIKLTSKMYWRQNTAMRLRSYAKNSGNARKEIALNNFPIGIDKLAKGPKIIESRFRKRQKDKIWLPTHLWHAKRAHFVHKWGFVIPSHPNEKIYRPTYRAGNTRQWDPSVRQAFSTMKEQQQAQAGPGAVVFDTSFYSTIVIEGQYSSLVSILSGSLTKGSISPIVFQGTKIYDDGLWDISGKYLGEGLIIFNARDNIDCVRRAAVRVHPSIFKSVWQTIMDEAERFRESDSSLHVNDCRFAIGSIDLLGWRSLITISSLLRSHVPEGHEEVSTMGLLSQLISQIEPRNLPVGFNSSTMLIDPRTFDLTPKERQNTDVHARPDEVKIRFHQEGYAGANTLFTVQGRSVKYANRKDADVLRVKRKREQERAMATGSGFPILKESEVLVPSVFVKQKNDAITILLPWQWINIFYRTLYHKGYTLFGGLDQYKQIMLERMLPLFPDDFPECFSGQQEESARARFLEDEWNKRPKSKKVIYDRLDLQNGEKRGEVGNPFICDWSLFISPKITADNDLTITPDPALSISYRHIKLYYIGRGAPSPCARIYAIPRSAREKWMSLKGVNRKLASQEANYPKCPGAKFLIGYVTNGSFNLKEGKGAGIGCVSQKHVELYGLRGFRYCVVRNAGEPVGRLAIMKF